MSDSLPTNWSEAELGDLVTVCRSKSDPQDFTDMPFVGMDNVEAHTMRLLGTVPAGTMRSKATHFFPQDILYGRLRPYLNKVLAATFEGLASAEFIPLTPERGIDPDFVRYRVNAADFVSFTSHLDEGDRPRVDWNGIRQFQVALPPSAEQRRIVEAIDFYLTRLDDAFASAKRVQAKLKAYRASVLKAAAEGRLVPTEASLARAEKRDYEPAESLLGRIVKERRRRWEVAELTKLKAAGKTPRDDKWKTKYREPAAPDTSTLPELPEGWSWATVEGISTKVVDGVHRKPDYVPRGVPFVTVKNLTAGPGIDLENLKYITIEDHKVFTARANPERGDLLVSKDGTLGVIRAVRTDSVFSIFVSVAMIKPVLVSMSDYLELALSSPSVQVQMVPKGSGLQHIHLEDLRRDCLPIPPTAEQARILEAAQRHMSVVDWVEQAISRNLARLSSVRRAALKWAFEGKLADQDPTDEPAEQLLARIHAERAEVTPTKKRRGRRIKGAA